MLILKVPKEQVPVVFRVYFNVPSRLLARSSRASKDPEGHTPCVHLHKRTWRLSWERLDKVIRGGWRGSSCERHPSGRSQHGRRCGRGEAHVRRVRTYAYYSRVKSLIDEKLEIAMQQCGVKVEGESEKFEVIMEVHKSDVERRGLWGMWLGD